MPPTPTISKQGIESIIHHVFLPPKVPQAAEDDDEVTFSNELTLLKLAGDALASFSAHVAPDETPAVEKAHQAVLQLYTLKDLSQEKLQQAFGNLCKDGGYLPLHVHAQNAAILVSREDKTIVFEFFELSPTNQAVMSTEGRLRRRFPASAVSFALSVFHNDDIHAALAAAIDKMNRQQVAEMRPRARKSRHDQIEERDTNNPSIVTDFLATILRTKGDVVQVPVLAKNTREQVNWQDARLPWRRSPSWLLTRVAIQTILSRHHDDALYKQFMVFFMAQILAAALPRSLPREVIYCMVAKISGRLQKMERTSSRPWLQSVESVVAAAVLSMEQSWEATNQQADPPQDIKLIPSKLLDRDTRIKLPALDKFIESLGLRKPIVNDGSFTPTWSVPEWTSSSLPDPAFRQTGDGAVVDLFAFEAWVAVYLDTWTSLHLDKEATPSALFKLMEAYHSSALNHYCHSPRSISLMVLTILELWVACDKSVCKSQPLLMEYTHQMPIDILQSLILPSKSQMERLHRAETYMQDRHSSALRRATPSIFHSFGQPKSFGVKFFLSSAHHQSVKTTIEARAQRERQAKIAEFQQKSAQYRTLMQQSQQRQCEYYTGYNRRNGVTFTNHDNNCQKCRLRKQAEAISITVHEWPLPDAPELAQNVVFELHVPHAFSIWRDATAFVVLTVLQFQQPDSTEAAPEEYLYRYMARDFTSSSSCGRFTLASIAKSNQRTHRKMQSLQTVSEDDILLENGLRYKYYDQIASKWVVPFAETQILSTECTYQLSKPCSSLQQFIIRPHQNPNGMTANHAISQQSECPEYLSLEEFKALAVLPCGYRIQWLNILAQLHMPIINFTNPDVVLMILQASQQAGPPSKDGIYRAGHWPLNDEAFALAFLKGLDASLGRTMLSIAQICVASFDVDECHLHNILESSSQAAVLLESSIIAYDASVGDSSSDTESIRLKRTLFKARNLLKNSIALENSPSLDMALRKTWAGYPGGAAWSTWSSKHEHWLLASTSTSEEDIPLRVQYNLLTGELLVNGLPLSRLPTPYQQHPTYATLFGKAALEILPTNIPGMAFSSKNLHHGYALFFAIRSHSGSSLYA
ncbi:uncharacterized protein LMH87_007528 [Akanthomyces muscarius]|uniref:ubiquitinyl hydrolase 1 n=1 Tax=Akanthomyces muscarius TaxID=2231603 RepID=A0A9W8QJD1_AKAMU|nr:uncharacterized protein LMH87_007528 [Akanthomyces muscarius]KAJ4159587.1 hypothetical protein LMH87_007528 [Akanthomyces muscarius]